MASFDKGTSHLLHYIQRYPKKRNHDIRQCMVKTHTFTDGSTSIKVHKFDHDESHELFITFLVATYWNEL